MRHEHIINGSGDPAAKAARVNVLIRNGDLLQAYAAAATALADHPDDKRLHYWRVLALARLGETDRAHAAYREAGLDNVDESDTLSLWARLEKDRALATADVADRMGLLLKAAHAYRDVYRRTGDYFPAINAASMLLLAGEREGARDLAGEVLAMPAITSPQGYYAAATTAEALLILGRTAEAQAAAVAALGFPDADPGARSSTCRQLASLAEAMGAGEDVVALFRPAPVLTYCGHMFLADAEAEADLAGAIAGALDSRGCTAAFGSLACGADILVAEAVLKRGCGLHVFLPFAEDDFLAQSVRPGGTSWVTRYRRCLEQASSVTIASTTPWLHDDNQFAYASQLMMGGARLRASFLNTHAWQLAIWDGVESAGVAGTGADVGRWRNHGGETVTLEPGAFDRELPRPEGAAPPGNASRAVRSIIFTDFKGFSKIGEAELPYFWEDVMGGVAAVIERHRDEVLCRNTWGDALFAVTASASAAAHIALELQEALVELALARFGEEAGMRVSVHLGPVYSLTDPVTGVPTVLGEEVNRTARIEPVTPVGQVYVSESFGAILAMEQPGQFRLSYVGRVKLAKAHGELGMYRLNRR